MRATRLALLSTVVFAALTTIAPARQAAVRRVPVPPSATEAPVAAADADKTQPFTVAVLGDGFGEALVSGLHASLDQDGGIAVQSVVHAGAGLNAAPRFDWVAAARTALSMHHIGAATVMLGGDDVGPLRDGETTVEPDSPRWGPLYGERVTALVAVFTAAGVPVTWVGLPIVADDDTATGYAALNEIIRDRATRAGARYIDSWDAFVDDGGRFAADGPDRNGRIAPLRTPDGRGFTPEGAAKLASFVDGDILRAHEEAVASSAVETAVAAPRQPAFQNDINAQIRRELGLPSLRGPTRDVRGPVMVITAPPLAPDGQLVAASVGPAALANSGGASLAEQALVEGRPLPPKPGRMDDFTWPRP